MNDISIKRQIRKFGFYGLFKNLKFFDPFLWVYLYSNGLDLTMIGVLIAIREVIIYVFEIPSGVFADKYGKKTELIYCFIFYIVSFILFFIGGEFYIFILAFIAFGFGEALRTGTHKAMIIEYMEINNIKEDKSKIYGLTRSYSLLGSAISSFLSVILVFFLPDLRLLFIISIIPYLIDMGLIMSYPNYLNEKQETDMTFPLFLKSLTVTVYQTLKEKTVRLTLIDSSLYNAFFKTIKDYIQPLLIAFMTGIYVFEMVDEEANKRVILGLTYMVIFIVSSITSKNSHKVMNHKIREEVLYLVWGITGIVFILLGLYLDIWLVLISLYILIYILQNIRKPIMVERIGDISQKGTRASVLSIESQLTSLFIMVLAPLFGFIYDQYGARYIFITLGLFNILLFVVTRLYYKRETL